MAETHFIVAGRLSKDSIHLRPGRNIRGNHRRLVGLFQPPASLVAGRHRRIEKRKNPRRIVVAVSGRKTEINPPDAIVELLVDEVARVEAEWDLV